MTGPPAFSDTPQGSKTGSGYVHAPESEAFIAEFATDHGLSIAESAQVVRSVERIMGRRAERRTQTVHITLTVDLPGDLRAAADGALRREFPRGDWKVTDA